MNSVNLWVPTQEEEVAAIQENNWLDFSTANALHTCPKYGIIRYHHGKKLPGEGRALSLEAGHALHRAFCMHRLHWWYTTRYMDRSIEYIDKEGYRIFGSKDKLMEGSWDDLRGKLADTVENACLEALYTSGYYDDPNDKTRTLSNMEESLLHYIKRSDIDQFPVVSVEEPISFGVQFSANERFIYFGRIDAVAKDGNETIILENKTGSGVGTKDWETQWNTSHQVTGYMIGMSMRLGVPVTRGRVIGLQIKLPIRNPYAGYKDCPVERNRFQHEAFFQWLKDAYDMKQRWGSKPFQATMNTNACYRYFRPCQFMPVCVADEPPEDFHEFEDARWHPYVEGDD